MKKRAATEIGIWIVIAVTVLFILSGCTQERPAIVRPPVELTECADEPQTPDIPAKDGTEATRDVRDAMVWTYILALRAFGVDCKAVVIGIKAYDQGLR
jgi:hypothetical protein